MCKRCIGTTTLDLLDANEEEVEENAATTNGQRLCGRVVGLFLLLFISFNIEIPSYVVFIIGDILLQLHIQRKFPLG